MSITEKKCIDKMFLFETIYIMNISAPHEIIGEGPPQIAVVTPSISLAVKAKEVAREMDITACVALTGIDEEVGVAHELLQHEQIQVIAGRGRLVHILRQEVDVPVLSVEFSSEDILERLLPFQNTGRHIGHLCFPDQATESEGMARLLGLRLTRFVVRNRNEVDEALDQASKLGIIHIIGGLGLVQKARDRGFEGIVLKSGSLESIRNMFREAACLIALGTRNRQQVEMIRCISDLNPNAILSIDKEYRITYANSRAQQLIGNGNQPIVGYLINELLPHVDCTQLLLQGAETADSDLTTNIAGRRVVMRHVPLSRHGDIEGAVLSLQDIVDVQRVERKIRQKLYAEQHIARMTFDDIIGDSHAMAKVKNQARRFARANASVLITGETGTGKEMFAQAIHLSSTRSGGRFVSVNCAALSETLLESELFGYEDGAFTGARRGGKEGLFELAHGGTLFLDEIGEMPLQLQTRLLRVLQDKRVMRVGGSHLVPVNVRILSATNRDIVEMIARGSFRDDLFYRINTLVLKIPPLRERIEDIPRLAEIYISRYAHQSPARKLTADALRKLQHRSWRGNVRELVHTLERAMILCESEEITSDLIAPDETSVLCSAIKTPLGSSSNLRLNLSERDAILQALVDNRYHKGRTAKALGISRATLWRKLRELDMSNDVQP